MKTIKYKTETKYRVLVPETIEKYNVAIPYDTWECDFCNRKALDEYRSCIGCGRHACYFCLDKKMLEHMGFEIGIPSDYSGDNSEYWVDASDDHRYEYIYLCESCKQNPPEKIKFLMEMVSAKRDNEKTFYKLLYDQNSLIIDEIAKLKNEERKK